MLKFCKKILCMLLALFCFCNSIIAAVVSDNDGSAFITKAEFDSLKNSFQNQIDSYNIRIDSKIDNAIASYLSGVTVEKKCKILTKNYADKKFADKLNPIEWKSGDKLVITGGLQARYSEKNTGAGVEICCYTINLTKQTNTGGIGQAETLSKGIDGKDTDKYFWMGKYEQIQVENLYTICGAYCWYHGSTQWKTDGTGMKTFSMLNNTNTMTAWGAYEDDQQWFQTKGYSPYWSGTYTYYTYINRRDTISYSLFNDYVCNYVLQRYCPAGYIDYVLYNKPEYASASSRALTDKWTFDSTASTRSELKLYFNSTFPYFEQKKYSINFSDVYNYGIYSESGVPVKLYNGIPLFTAEEGTVTFTVQLGTNGGDSDNISLYFKDSPFINDVPENDNTIEMTVYKIDGSQEEKIGEKETRIVGKNGEKYKIEFHSDNKNNIYDKMTGEVENGSVWLQYVSDIRVKDE